MKFRYPLHLLLLNVAWSATPSIYQHLAPKLDSGALPTLRFGIGGWLLAMVWPWIPGRAPRGWDLFRTILLGLMVFCLGHRLQVHGVQTGSASNSALLMAIEPLLTALMAAVFLKERIRRSSRGGFALGVLGVLLLNRIFNQGFALGGLLPSLFFIGSLLCETAYSILGKGVVSRSHYAKAAAIALLAGTVGNLLIDGRSTVEAAMQLNGGDWLLILFMALICTAIGYTYWFRVIQETDVNLAGLTIYAQPVSGFQLAWWWLGETPHSGHLWGSLAIVAGLWVAFGPSNAKQTEARR